MNFRSMTLNHMLFGTPLYTLKVLDYVLYTVTGWSLIGPSLVFLLPRLVMLVLSFVVDWCVYQVCKLYRHNFNQCLTTLASSYVMLVYSTRSFSNSIELASIIYLHCFAGFRQRDVCFFSLVNFFWHIQQNGSVSGWLFNMFSMFPVHINPNLIKKNFMITIFQFLLFQHSGTRFYPLLLGCTLHEANFRDSLSAVDGPRRLSKGRDHQREGHNPEKEQAHTRYILNLFLILEILSINQWCPIVLLRLSKLWRMSLPIDLGKLWINWLFQFAPEKLDRFEKLWRNLTFKKKRTIFFQFAPASKLFPSPVF